MHVLIESLMRAVIAEFKKSYLSYTLADEANWPAGKEPQFIEPLQKAFLDDLRRSIRSR
jgi:hypothetical protein